MFSFTAFTTQVGEKVIYHRICCKSSFLVSHQFSCFTPAFLIHMLQHQLSCFSKFLLLKVPSTEFLHCCPTYNQSQEPNLSVLEVSTTAVKLGSQKRYVNSTVKQLFFVHIYDFKKDLIFITSFSTTVTIQLSLCNHSTKINTVLSCPQHTQLSLKVSLLLHWLILMQIILYGPVGILILPCLSPCFHTSRLLDRKCNITVPTIGSC